MEACFSILVFCLSKLSTTSFHLFMAVTAFSMHMPSSVLVDFLVPLLIFLLLFFLLPFLVFLVLLVFFLLFDLFLLLFFSPFFWVLFLFLKVFLFLLAASASADLATREDPSSSDRLLSSMSSSSSWQHQHQQTWQPGRIQALQTGCSPHCLPLPPGSISISRPGNPGGSKLFRQAALLILMVLSQGENSECHQQPKDNKDGL